MIRIVTGSPRRFSTWNVKHLDEAFDWATRCPNPSGGRSRMEIRPFHEAQDYGDFMTPEERAAPSSGERGALGVA